MFFSLDINKRTIAFLAAIFTTVQSILWIIGYILYILAYSCRFNYQKFETNKADLPLDLGSYYIWYLQDDNCVTSGEWINHKRGLSSTCLVILISLGLSWNSALLSISINMLYAFYTDYGNFNIRLIIYSYSVIFVSIWDLVLVVIISVDIVPLLNKENYSILEYSTNTQSAGILALPYFTEVYTVLILLFGRFFFLWLTNTFFASYLLVKTYSANRSSTSPPNQATENTLWEMKRNIPPRTPPEAGKDYFGQRSKNQIPSLPQNGFYDEVSQRWMISEGRNHADSDFYEDDGVQDNFQQSSTDIRTRGSMAPSEEQWNTVERHINENNKGWRNGGVAILPNVKRAESITKLTVERKPSFLQSMRESFSKPKLPSSKPPDNFEEPFKNQKKHEGFSYIPPISTNPTSQEEINPFKVHLKHVHRPSISNEEPGRATMESSSGEANPYLVSPLSSLDPSYVPRGHKSYPKTPPVSPPLEVNTTAVNVKPPPMPPAVDAPKYVPNIVTFKNQMSLQDEIRTMRPLKPVNRPGIDTNC